MNKSVAPKKDTPNCVSRKKSNGSNNAKDPPMEVSSKDQPKEEWMDVLGNGQLKKKIVKKGKKNLKPQNGDLCTISVYGMLEDGTKVDDSIEMLIQIGDLEVVQGLDLTIALMELGETAEIKVHPRFAYGSRGSIPSIPPDATITYLVELETVECEPDIETLSIDQRREIGNKKRERGNWWFIRKDFSFAIQCYRRALQFLEIKNGKKWNENEETEAVTDTELQVLVNDCTKVYNNLAAALMETEAYNAALENVNLVLKYQPQNTKALFRKGKLLHIKGEYEKAFMTFLEAQKLEPEMKPVQVELMSLKDKISKESKKEKDLYAKMLGINKNADEPLEKVEKKKERTFTIQKVLQEILEIIVLTAFLFTIIWVCIQIYMKFLGKEKEN